MKYLSLLSLFLVGCSFNSEIKPIVILTQPDVIIIPENTELILIGNEKYKTQSNEVWYSEGYFNKKLEEFKRDLAK